MRPELASDPLRPSPIMSRPISPTSPAHANDYTYKSDNEAFIPAPFQDDHQRRQHHASLLSSPVSLHLAQLRAYHGEPIAKDALEGGEFDHTGRWVPLPQPRLPPSDDVFGGQAMEQSNSLGLFDAFSEPSHASSSGNMGTMHPNFTQHRSHHQHTDSMSSTSSFHDTAEQSSHDSSLLQRQDSFSGMSQASSISYYQNGTRTHPQSEVDDHSPHSAAFPRHSPVALQNISGLAISTAQEQQAAYDELLSLSAGEMVPEHQDLLQRHADFTFPSAPQLMAPPASTNKRRATQLAHSLYTSDVRQLRTDYPNGDDKTPMPANAQAFPGQQPMSEVADMAAARHQTPAHGYQGRNSHPHQPSTPASSSSVATMVGVPGQSYHPDTPSHVPPQYSPFTFMTPQYGTHPHHSPEGTFSGMGSSLSGSAFSAPRLARMDSFESAITSTDSSSPSSDTYADSFGPAGRSLEMAFADHEAKAGSSAFGGPQHAHLQADMPGSSSIGMSRIASAPTFALRDNGPAEHMHGGPPSTPQRSQQTQQPHGSTTRQRQDAGVLPATPSAQTGPHGQHAHLAHLTMSAPPMATSKSMGFLSSPHHIASPAASIDGMPAGLYTPFGTPHGAAHRAELFDSPLASSLAVQSPSSGVFRTMSGRNRGMSQSNAVNTAQMGVMGANKARPGVPPPLIVSSADKLHVCHCGKRFKRLEHLKRHSRVHTQERPHQCPAPGCNKWFGRTDNLTQHLRTHYRTLGRSSESLLRITQSAQSATGSPTSAQSMSLAMSGMAMPAHMPLTPLEGLPLHQMPHESPLHMPTGARNDPHAAAAAAAARVVSKQQHPKRRLTISNDALLGGPIALVSPTTNRSPTTATHEHQHASQ